MIRAQAAVWLLLFGLLVPQPAESGQDTSNKGPNGAPLAPEAPAVIARDGSGRATIRATRLATPIRIDGQLDEAAYADVSPVSDFIQIEPQEGAAATQKTEVWVFFDRDQVYITARCWESDPERMVASEMRRDNSANFQGSDNVGFLLDTFYDRQNATVVIINPAGGRNDGQVTNERQWNGDWNPIYDFQVGRFEGGWTVEIAFPFRFLRYATGGQMWGFNVVRNNYWKNELSAITRMPAVVGIFGVLRASLAATLVGLEVPTGSRNLEIKPYVVSNVASDVQATPKISNEFGSDVGVDMKYSLTQSLTADFTYNTDFAQVEADEQQVNLTRFGLLFPEKREFFLENRGLFEFGGAGGTTTTDTPILFYSRRIGLNEGREVPIGLGGRLTGRVGRYSVGFLNIQTDDEPVSASVATNFTVARVKRDILRKSNIGAMSTGRSATARDAGTNQAYGVDGTFAFFDNLIVSSYWARTRTDGVTGDDTSYRANLDYAGDRYGVQAERLAVGDQFTPEIGFVRRDGMRRSFGLFRFSPRPRALTAVRKFSWIGSVDHIDNDEGRTEARNASGEFAIELHNSDRYSIGYVRAYEFLPAPFPIATGVIIPAGGYDAASTKLGLTFGSQRPIAGIVSVEHGSFYSGHKTAVSVTRGRVEVMRRLSLEPSVSINRVNLPEGSFTTHLIGSRVTYTMTPRMFTSALLQYNSGANSMSSNVRFRWEYRPGSELFVVYSEQRDTLTERFPALMNRALIVKVNRLLSF